MPDLIDDGTPPELPPAAAVPPIIDPDSYEHFEGWRETTLSIFTDPEANATLRAMADFIYTLSLEYCRFWPREPEGSFRHQCRAVVADLRHLQGFLAMLGREGEASVLNNHEGHLSRMCRGLSGRVKAAADTLEKELGEWRGEA